MSDNILLAHDIGTSGTKSSLLRPDGVALASEATPHATRFGPGGCAEQNAEDWWAGVCRNTRALLAAQPGARDRIAGIGVSGHMLCCLPVDARGTPLRPCLIHSDCRSFRETACVAREVGAQEVYRITGNIVDPRSPLCKMLWLKEHEPASYHSTTRFLQSKDFIVGRLTGTYDSTDLSDASHAQWLDVRRRVYARDLLTTLGLDPAKLPALHCGTDVVGRLSREASEALGLTQGIPVVAGGGDGACATVGAGAVRPGDTYCCIGTTAWIASVTHHPTIDPQARVFNILPLDGQGCAVYGTIQSAGRSLDWMMELLGEKNFARFDALLAAAPAGSDGLLFLPYLEGERSPIWDANARGVLFGMTPAHRREHLLRATVEGVSLALRSVLDVMRETGELPAMRLIGGGGQSVFWQQLLADICAIDVQVLSVKAADATSVGAAVAAGVGVGLFAGVAEGTKAISIVRTNRPRPELEGTYARQYEVYRALYPCLKDAFARLQASLRAAPPHSDVTPG